MKYEVNSIDVWLKASEKHRNQTDDNVYGTDCSYGRL